MKAEILAHEQSCITVEMLSMFVVAYEEQARTEEILRLALPQLRSKHLLLASFGTFEEENEQFRVSVIAKPLTMTPVLRSPCVVIGGWFFAV